MRLGQCPAIKKVSPLHDRCAEVKFFYDLSGKAVFNAGKLYANTEMPIQKREISKVWV